MRMYLPFVDPSSLSLGRVEDDVLVGADGVRRRVRLASVLRRCVVNGAELDGSYLIIRFSPDPRCSPVGREHERLVAEFRALAETVLTRLEPVLLKAAAATADVASDSASADTQPVFTGCSWCWCAPSLHWFAVSTTNCWHSSRVKQRYSLRCFARFSKSFSGGRRARSWTGRRPDGAGCGANSDTGICPDQRDGQGLTSYPGRANAR